MRIQCDTMSLAQIWKAEGELKGKLETARNMLAEDCDPVFIVKVTGLTLAEVKAIQQKII